MRKITYLLQKCDKTNDFLVIPINELDKYYSTNYQKWLT